MAVVTACITVGVMGNSNVECTSLQSQCTSLQSQCFIKKIVQGGQNRGVGK